MRVLASVSLGGSGHLGPLVPFLAAARRRGDETLVVGPAALARMVDQAGFPFRPGGEPSEAEIAPIREQLPVVPHREAVVLGNRELFARLAATALLPEVARVCDEWRPDVILRDPTEYASAVVARDRGIPTAQVALSLAEAEEGSLAAAEPALEEHRAGLTAALRATPYLSRFPASLDPSPFPATARYHEPPSRRVGLLPDWWDGADAPLVYLTFGTVLGHMSFAADVFRDALDALAGEDLRVLMTIGPHLDPGVVGPVPANAHVEAWVDQADALGSAALVACHGGSGTSYGALAAGVPLVFAPRFADQFENARRITAAGAGVTVGAGGLRDGVRAVLADGSYRRAAARIAAEMAAVPTVDAALDRLLTGAQARANR
jgi:Erythromycin biosynthesis protein CIII-like, C-terminal domain/Erythromycin biosynthesis protein CIII-like, N-terminal domain